MADKDKRSMFSKAKDELKQVGKGVKNYLDRNEIRNQYGPAKISSGIRDFKAGYNKEENKQKTAREKNMKMGGTMKKKTKDNRYGQGGVMQHD
tara:strand:+ start:4905 stop:5183 length:279 start_codon:yes stop_codon:yes gene_type:complete